MKIRQIIDRHALRHVRDVPRDVIISRAEDSLVNFSVKLTEFATLSESLGELYSTKTITPQQGEGTTALALLQTKIFDDFSEQIALLHARLQRLLALS